MFSGLNGHNQPPPGLAKPETPSPSLTNTQIKKSTHNPPLLSPDSPEFQCRVEAAIIDRLSKRPQHSESLQSLGIFLRARNLAPQDGLKRFLSFRNDKFSFFDEGNGTIRAILMHRPTQKLHSKYDERNKIGFEFLDIRQDQQSDYGLHLGPSPTPRSSTLTSIAMNDNSSSNNNSIGATIFGSTYYPTSPPGTNEKRLERQLVQFIVDNRSAETPVSMPSLGEYCIKHLGFSMKGYLHRFLEARSHLFILPDDGRQHVLLQPGAEAVLVDMDDDFFPDLPDELILDDLGINDGPMNTNNNEIARDDVINTTDLVMYGPSRTTTSMTTTTTTTPTARNSYYTFNNNNNDSNNENYSIARRPAEYSTWDRISQELFDYLRLRGGTSSFKAAEDYIKGRCPHLIQAMGFNPDDWQIKHHTWKRRNIFRKEGADLALLTYHKEHISLHGAKKNEQEDGTPQVKGQQALDLRILDELKDWVKEEIDSMTGKTIIELQKENAGLRAACETLGRELLVVKEELADLKAQLASSFGMKIVPRVDRGGSNGMETPHASSFGASPSLGH